MASWALGLPLLWLGGAAAADAPSPARDVRSRLVSRVGGILCDRLHAPTVALKLGALSADSPPPAADNEYLAHVLARLMQVAILLLALLLLYRHILLVRHVQYVEPGAKVYDALLEARVEIQILALLNIVSAVALPSLHG